MPEVPARAPQRPSRPAGVEKAAILLATLGPEAAGAVLAHLSDAEVRQVSAAIARLRSIAHEQAAVVHEEAWRRLSNQESVYVDGESFASRVLATAQTGRGHDASRGELKRLTHAGADFLASSLETVPADKIARVIAGEHPQVIALVLANLRARQAAQVLGALPEDRQPEIVHRIVDLQGVPEDLLAEVGDVLHGLLDAAGGSGGDEPAAAGGARRVAELMNLADDAVEARVFTHLDEIAPELAETIRGLMFTFEDLIRLDNRAMQVVLKEVQREDLMLALKTASPGMKQKIFGNLSQRAAEILRDDMSTMGPVRLKDVEKAQAAVVATVRRLEQEQKITVGGTGEDVIA